MNDKNMKKLLENKQNAAPKGQARNTSEGFTLIEIAIVTIISGIMFIPLFQMYQTYRSQQRIEVTIENIEISLSLVSSLLDRYPCPADPELPPSDPNYGQEQCTAGGGVKVVAGARTPAETVLIGAVPIRAIKNNASGLLSDDFALDAWGNKLLYAVTTSQTNGATYSSDSGQIDAVNEFNSTTAPIVHSPTAGFDKNASFVILSHGPNGNGAYNSSGALVSACGTTRKEDENCNDDSTFMAALGFYEGDAANYFDDIAYFSAKTDNSLWDSIDPAVSGDIYSKNKRNVGIKQPSPTQKLDVNGSIISTGNTKAKEICDYTNNTTCFEIEKISGATGISCGDGEVMTGISDGNVTCTNMTAAAPIDKDCKAEGKWVTGLKSDGTVICSP